MKLISSLGYYLSTIYQRGLGMHLCILKDQWRITVYEREQTWSDLNITLGVLIISA